MTRLRSCDACSRHVLVTEQSCPFCKHRLAVATMPAPQKLPSGLSRAQRLAVAAAIASGQALAACADSTPMQPDNPAAGTGASAGQTANAGKGAANGGIAGQGVAVPVYGAPLAGNPGVGPTAGFTPIPPYGTSPPPPPTAGKKADPVPDAGAPDDDAGTTTVPDGGHMVHPVYGAPPVP
jgi:hypothetical protein